MNEGLFGMIILFIFEVLPILEETKINVSTLNWNISSKNYGYIFQNILEYNSEYVEKDTNNLIELGVLKQVRPQYVLGDNFLKLNKLFFKYFKIPTKLNNYAQNLNLDKFLGIHFRGTDKSTDCNMNTPLLQEDFYIILDSYIHANNIKFIFLATDDNIIYDTLKNKYNNIVFKTSRDFNHDLFRKNNNNPESNGIEAMIDMLCLSKCETVLKISSALSAFSKIINPNLNIYRLNACKMFADIPYFPDAYIPLLKINKKYTSECNNIIDKVQKNDWSYTHKKNFNNFYYKIR